MPLIKGPFSVHANPPSRRAAPLLFLLNDGTGLYSGADESWSLLAEDAKLLMKRSLCVDDTLVMRSIVNYYSLVGCLEYQG